MCTACQLAVIIGCACVLCVYVCVCVRMSCVCVCHVNMCWVVCARIVRDAQALRITPTQCRIAYEALCLAAVDRSVEEQAKALRLMVCS